MATPLKTIFESSKIGLPRPAHAKLESFLTVGNPSVDFFGNPCVPLNLDTKDGTPQPFEWTPVLTSLIELHSKGVCLSKFKPSPADAFISQGIRLHRCQVGCAIPIHLITDLVDNFISLPLAASLLIGVSPKFTGASVPLESRVTSYLPMMLEGTPQFIQVSFTTSSSDLKWHVRFTRISNIPKGSNLILASAISEGGHPFVAIPAGGEFS